VKTLGKLSMGRKLMRAKTARRFLARNRVKMFKHEFNYKFLPPSFLRRWKEAVRVLVREWKNG
jgi:hypothetical protein